MSDRGNKAGQVLICHPGRQHAHQAALALAGQGMLAGFILGLPSLERHGRFVPARWRGAFFKHGLLDLPPDRVRFWPVEPAVRHMAGALLPPKAAAVATYWGLSFFDALTARSLRGWEAQAVIAYENSALHTFRAARRLGWTTILDAASFHHLTQDRWSAHEEPAWLHRRICRRKDEEVALADRIITCSGLARESYVEAGVPPSKVIAVPLGVDTARFQPSPPTRVPDSPTFLFVGTVTTGKGIDLLVEAFQRVQALCPQASLRLVGGKGNAWPLVRPLLGPAVSWQTTLSHEALSEEYRKATCLVLPSRFDSFGMVVAEALASGLPVIVSDRTGAKELVTEGSNGWVIPAEDVKALTERMFWCAQHPKELAEMAGAARQAGLSADWKRYHKRLVAAVRESLLTRQEPKDGKPEGAQ
jgi:glycosyltransferase involved in cell wall biosynthesis